MGLEHLENRYEGLRADLESAYASARWDSARIDAIADELVQLELRISSQVNETDNQTVKV